MEAAGRGRRKGPVQQGSEHGPLSGDPTSGIDLGPELHYPRNAEYAQALLACELHFLNLARSQDGGHQHLKNEFFMRQRIIHPISEITEVESLSVSHLKQGRHSDSLIFWVYREEDQISPPNVFLPFTDKHFKARSSPGLCLAETKLLWKRILNLIRISTEDYISVKNIVNWQLKRHERLD